MSLWIDKHRPNILGKLTVHNEINNRLIALARSEEIPHLMFYGPSGAGKKTRVLCLLREIFGAGVEKKKLEHRTMKTTTGRTIEITTIGSNYHIECNPSDAGTADRFVIQEVIKEIASHSNINSVGNSSRSFKIVVLTEVDKLSRQAQAGLRRTMERYSSQCRVILVCNSPSRVIEPIRSRCLGIRIPSPPHEDIVSTLISVAKKEQCSCPEDLAVKISMNCDRNLRRALLMLEAARVQSNSNVLDVKLPVAIPDWELYINKLAKDILSEQTPSKLLHVRDMLYELLVNCIPADVIIQTICKELMKAVDDMLKHEIIFWAAYYEHRIRIGSKEIFHLEAFVAKFMAIYKRWLVSCFG